MPFIDEPKVAKNTQRRVALVIGNSAYHTGPLKNPRNDAEAVAAKLQDSGSVNPPFHVTVALDVGRDAMARALEEFEDNLGSADAALLYFAGHGLQVKGVNFMMPVDADIRQETHLRFRAFSLNDVLEIMGRRVRKSSLVFLDACRDNPFARSLLSNLGDEERGRFLVRSGLAEVRVSTGSYVAFATAPDNVAFDGKTRNSPFTEGLLRHMGKPNVSINELMIAVRRDVLEATGGKQEPWDQSSLREVFCFNEAAIVPERREVVAPVIDVPAQANPFSEALLLEKAAIEHWEMVKGTKSPDRLQKFINDYGASRMAPLARDALKSLSSEAWKKVNKRDKRAVAEFVKSYNDVLEPEAPPAILKANTDLPTRLPSVFLAGSIPTSWIVAGLVIACVAAIILYQQPLITLATSDLPRSARLQPYVPTHSDPDPSTYSLLPRPTYSIPETTGSTQKSIKRKSRGSG